MAKLKEVVHQLSAKDFQSIYNSLINSDAERAASLFRHFRDQHLTEKEIQKELDTYGASYYALCSRLLSKIEDYLLEQMDNRRGDLSKKVSTINELVLTKKKHVALTVLKKLEKELVKYDLSNELTVVYKTLKKIHINTSEYFNYSQLYNKHIAYMLALDKVEDLVAEFFKKFGIYNLTGNEHEKLALSLINDEIQNVAKLYDSHRLHVYESIVKIFYRLVIEKKPNAYTIEERFEKIEQTFKTYRSDIMYQHLEVVIDLLKYEYYVWLEDSQQASQAMANVNKSLSFLLSNYGLYIYPMQFLITKTRQCIEQDREETLYEDNINLLYDFEPEVDDIPKYITYMIYRGLSCYYAERYEEAIRWFKKLCDEIDTNLFKNVMREVQLIITLLYIFTDEKEIARQQLKKYFPSNIIESLNSYTQIFYRLLDHCISKEKENKKDLLPIITEETNQLRKIRINHFSPILMIKLDKKLINKLADRFEYTDQ